MLLAPAAAPTATAAVDHLAADRDRARISAWALGRATRVLKAGLPAAAAVEGVAASVVHGASRGGRGRQWLAADARISLAGLARRAWVARLLDPAAQGDRAAPRRAGLRARHGCAARVPAADI